MRKNHSNLFSYSCVSASQRVFASLLASIISIVGYFILFVMMNDHDDIKIGKGEFHPISLLFCATAALTAKQFIHKFLCSTQPPTTTAIISRTDCFDQTRLLAVRYLIPATVGMLFALMISFAVTVHASDDQEVLHRSSHLLSASVVSMISTLLNDLINHYGLGKWLGCRTTRPAITNDEFLYINQMENGKH